jgi:NADP-dependent 3-hydroxy acid dehydrogenase YdfG
MTEKDDNTTTEHVYFNNAGQARLHPDVASAGIAAIQDPFCTDSTTTVPRIRECFAQLIQARSQDIALMPSTAFAHYFCGSQPCKTEIVVRSYNNHARPKRFSRLSLARSVTYNSNYNTKQHSM